MYHCGRLDDYEWDLDYLQQLARLSNSPYVVGIDFMGHETNSTRQIERQLRHVAQWADRHRPGFAIRVHAGENPGHPENVRVAMDCVDGLDVILRIGHGLYGVDDETLDRFKATDTIIEFNLNSNLVLNNIQSAAEVPMQRYLQAGVQVVLGTDGYGIYNTSLHCEARAARLLGASVADLEAMRRTELAYLNRRFESDASTDACVPIPQSVPARHFTAEASRRSDTIRRRQRDALSARLQRLQINIIDVEDVITSPSQRNTICIAGAWRNAWQRMPPSDQGAVREFLNRLLSQLDPTRFQLITGGTSLGVEGEVARLAKQYGIPHFGAIVWESPLGDVAPDLDGVLILAENLWEKALALYKCMVAVDAHCLFIGGGNIVSDEIQVARNLRAQYLLMADVGGASSTHARLLPNRAFRSAAEVLSVVTQRIWDSPSVPYWHLGPNPIVDLVLLRQSRHGHGLEVLLIRRGVDAVVEAGLWALPGGFQLTDAPRGTRWQPGRESAESACLREAAEETGLDLQNLEGSLQRVGMYRGGGRDPRDTEQAWGESTVFLMHAPNRIAHAPVLGGDDACEAQWYSVNDLPPILAFDHDKILRDVFRADMVKCGNR